MSSTLSLAVSVCLENPDDAEVWVLDPRQSVSCSGSYISTISFKPQYSIFSDCFLGSENTCLYSCLYMSRNNICLSFFQDGSSNQQGEEAKQREADMRNTILAQVLDQSARARLNNLALVKPEKATAVENYLIQMARFGKLGGKISESGLIEILEKVSQQTEKKTTVKFNRRRVMDSDDEDDDY
ncbi:hypothetical protein WMY93_013255 [Mugilogobius chulae]|uniref:Programmed cell death protein 5 n=1 Tax=Mugilogobius chulae TaxID=88201 RepID=A0AAW0PAX9_9GOBI